LYFLKFPLKYYDPTEKQYGEKKVVEEINSAEQRGKLYTVPEN
jgi:hypothetical protein